MSRKKADELGLEYHYKFSYGVLAGCDPTVMGIGPIPAVQKLFKRTGLTAGRYRPCRAERGLREPVAGLHPRPEA